MATSFAISAGANTSSVNVSRVMTAMTVTTTIDDYYDHGIGISHDESILVFLTLICIQLGCYETHIEVLLKVLWTAKMGETKTAVLINIA